MLVRAMRQNLFLKRVFSFAKEWLEALPGLDV